MIGYFSKAQTVEFGAKAGVNFSRINGDNTGDLERKTNFHLGLVTEIPLGVKFALQPEILYSSQGAKVDYTENVDGFTYSYKFKLNLDYINVPLLAEYSITQGLSLQAGPQIGYLIKADVERIHTIEGGNRIKYRGC